MSTPRPLILVSNDDGVSAPGNIALRAVLTSFADVITVAPLHEQSGKSHAISLNRPLRHQRVEPGVYAVDGTPVDCVYVALFHGELLPRRPDVVVAGINHGSNLGGDVYYSGTVAAAREAALRGIPSIAFSLLPGGNMAEAAVHARSMTQKLLGMTPPDDQTVLLNVNFPATELRGVRATKLGVRQYAEAVEVRQDPRGRDYFWLGGPGDPHHEPVPGSDTEAVDEGYASVTPLRLGHVLPDHLGVAALIAGARPKGRT